jgi:hypothetical protein
MTSPRRHTDAPVLFRLPNLQAPQRTHEAEHAWTNATQETVNRYDSGRSDRPEDVHARHGDSYSAASHADRPAAFASQPAPVTITNSLHDNPHSHTLLSQLPDLIAKRSVILVVMSVITCGAWFAGRRTAEQPSNNGGLPVVIIPQTPEVDTLQVDVGEAMSVAVRSEPKAGSAKHSTKEIFAGRDSVYRTAEPTIDDGNDFYLPEDLPVSSLANTDPPSVVQPRQTATPIDPHDIFATLSFESLSPPANQLGSLVADTAPPSDSSPQAPPAVEPKAAPVEGRQTVAKEPAEGGKRKDVSAAAATDLSATSGASDTESVSTVSADAETPKLKRVLSSTPNDIQDWTRYLPGGGGAVRAASADALTEPGNPLSQPFNRQASYYDND